MRSCVPLDVDRVYVPSGTAIETPMKVTVRLTLVKDKPYVKTPHFSSRNPHSSDEEFYTTTGVDPGVSLCPSSYFLCLRAPRVLHVG